MARVNYKQKTEELTKDLQRLQAEFDNYRKREEIAKQQLTKNATKQLIQQILPVLDTFELALKSTPDSPARQGMEMIYTQLTTVLQENGVTKIPTKEFNPELHEAVMTETGEKDNQILEVITQGYKLNNITLRHAKVKISRRKTK